MEEKKSLKISLSTFLLLIAILVIIVMAYFMYKLNNEKNAEIQKVTKLNNQVSSLESTTKNLQGKIDNVSNIVNNDANIKEKKNTDTITNEDAEKIIKEEFKKIDELYFNPEKYLKVSKTADEDSKYLINDYLQDISKYLTGNAKVNFKPYCVIEENGKYYLCEGGGFVSYNGLKKIEAINITDSKINAKVITKHEDPDKKSLEDISSDIELIKDGENWLVSELDFSVFE